MTVVTGGRHNGKLDYVTGALGVSRQEVLDLGELTANDASREMKDYGVLYHLETYIRKSLLSGENPGEIINEYVSAHPDCIIVCDEVGSGIIPIKKEDDEWREAVGRIMCRLSLIAGGITRVTCGIAEEIRHDP